MLRHVMHAGFKEIIVYLIPLAPDDDKTTLRPKPVY